VYVLRVPVRYYRQPPTYFGVECGSPRWDEHPGSSWEQSHRGWNSWNRGLMPQVAPLPVYQRQYTGNRYPSIEQQQVLRVQSYRYQPKDVVVRQYYQVQPVPYAQGNSPKQVQKREHKRVEQQAKFEQKQAKEQAKFEQKQAKHDQKQAKHEQKQAKHEQKQAKHEQKQAKHEQKLAKHE
jgi:hypothetical protein